MGRIYGQGRWRPKKKTEGEGRWQELKSKNRQRENERIWFQSGFEFAWVKKEAANGGKNEKQCSVINYAIYLPLLFKSVWKCLNDVIGAHTKYDVLESRPIFDVWPHIVDAFACLPVVISLTSPPCREREVWFGDHVYILQVIYSPNQVVLILPQSNGNGFVRPIINRLQNTTYEYSFPWIQPFISINMLHIRLRPDNLLANSVTVEINNHPWNSFARLQLTFIYFISRQMEKQIWKLSWLAWSGHLAAASSF